MLGRVVDLELVRESLGLLRGEGLVERGGRVGVQVVEDQDDPVSIGMADVDEVLDQPCPVLPGAVIGDGQVSGAQQGLAEAEDVGHTVASVLVVEALGQTGQRGQGRADLADQLLGHLIQTDQRTLRIEGSGMFSLRGRASQSLTNNSTIRGASTSVKPRIALALFLLGGEWQRRAAQWRTRRLAAAERTAVRTDRRGWQRSPADG